MDGRDYKFERNASDEAYEEIMRDAADSFREPGYSVNFGIMRGIEIGWGEALARIAVLEAVLREQTDLVDRLCSAVERSENDIGGEGSLTVLGLLGPMNDRARRALTTTLAAVPMTLGENFDQSGRVEVGADDPLAKALRPSPETIAEIERIERGNR